MNQNAEIIDELNRRIEIHEDEKETIEADTLKSFFEWFVGKYI